jgi:hypothetical protein
MAYTRQSFELVHVCRNLSFMLVDELLDKAL